jgi:2'-deoxynucleoside 5'-phosphate N-hydrolase
MIIYCASPIRGDRKYEPIYKEIVNHINSLGHTALSELADKFKSTIPLTDAQIFKRDVKWMESSQLMIAEVSSASTGVGFEVAYFLYHLKKPVLVFTQHGEKSVSAMIIGNDSELLTIQDYIGVEDMKKSISRYLNEKQNS